MFPNILQPHQAISHQAYSAVAMADFTAVTFSQGTLIKQVTPVIGFYAYTSQEVKSRTLSNWPYEY